MNVRNNDNTSNLYDLYDSIAIKSREYRGAFVGLATRVIFLPDGASHENCSAVINPNKQWLRFE